MEELRLWAVKWGDLITLGAILGTLLVTSAALFMTSITAWFIHRQTKATEKMAGRPEAGIDILLEKDWPDFPEPGDLTREYVLTAFNPSDAGMTLLDVTWTGRKRLQFYDGRGDLTEKLVFKRRMPRGESKLITTSLMIKSVEPGPFDFLVTYCWSDRPHQIITTKINA